MMKTLVCLVLGLFLQKVVVAGLSRRVRQVELDTYDSANYDVDLENLNLETPHIYDYDVGGLAIEEPQIEIGTLAPLVDSYQAPTASLEEEGEELSVIFFSSSASSASGVSSGFGVSSGSSGFSEASGASITSGSSGFSEASGASITSGSSGSSASSTSSASGESEVLIGPDTQEGLPTCLLCTCLGGSVYCDDLKLRSVPPLPKETTHFYARYNRITKINKSDFAHMNNLRKIDVTSNGISAIDEGALSGLPALEELVLRENNLARLPALPATMNLIDASHNRLGSKGIHNEAFKDMHNLMYLYLTDNDIIDIPVPLPDSLRSLHLQNNNIQMMHEDTFCNMKDFNYIRNGLEDIRLDGNPINLSKTPQAYVCLPRVPIGNLI